MVDMIEIAKKADKILLALWVLLLFISYKYALCWLSYLMNTFPLFLVVFWTFGGKAARKLSSGFWIINIFAGWIVPVQNKLMAYVLKRATKGDPVSVVNEIDRFGWEEYGHMSVGDVKGKEIDKAIHEHGVEKIQVGAEFGGYLGYSSIRFSHLFANDAKLYSIDPTASVSAI